MENNICPKCGKVAYEELYGGTISPSLCRCEPVIDEDEVEAVATYYLQGDAFPGMCGGSIWPGWKP